MHLKSQGYFIESSGESSYELWIMSWGASLKSSPVYKPVKNTGLHRCWWQQRYYYYWGSYRNHYIFSSRHWFSITVIPFCGAAKWYCGYEIWKKEEKFSDSAFGNRTFEVKFFEGQTINAVVLSGYSIFVSNTKSKKRESERRYKEWLSVIR